MHHAFYFLQLLKDVLIGLAHILLFYFFRGESWKIERHFKGYVYFFIAWVKNISKFINK